jgi:hypothetical protein
VGIESVDFEFAFPASERDAVKSALSGRGEVTFIERDEYENLNIRTEEGVFEATLTRARDPGYLALRMAVCNPESADGTLTRLVIEVLTVSHGRCKDRQSGSTLSSDKFDEALILDGIRRKREQFRSYFGRREEKVTGAEFWRMKDEGVW